MLRLKLTLCVCWLSFYCAAQQVTIPVDSIPANLKIWVDLGLNIQKPSEQVEHLVQSIENISPADSEPDLMRILAGKVIGLEVFNSNGLSGTSTSAVLRGFTFAELSNQPLIIVNGIPFDSQLYSDLPVQEGRANFSSRILDIDPQSIKDIKVIRGLAASLIYGEKGKNGVILINTLSEFTGDPFNIEFSQSFRLDRISNLPRYQNKYGSGFRGDFGWTFSSWGAPYGITDSLGVDAQGTIQHPYDFPFNTASLPEYIGQRYAYRAYDNVKNFYQNGFSNQSSLRINKSLGKYQLGLIYNRNKNSGILPDEANTLSRNSIAIEILTSSSNKLSVQGMINYSNTSRTAPPSSFSSGSNPVGPSLFSNLLYTPSNIDLLNLPYEDPETNLMLYYRRLSPIQNPVWSAKYMSDEEESDRIWGFISLNYKVNDQMSLIYRGGIDQFRLIQERKINFRGSQVPLGQYNTYEYRKTSFQQNLTGRYIKQLNANLELYVHAGLELSSNRLESTTFQREDQFVFGQFTDNNFSTKGDFNSESLSGIFSPYADISLDFRNAIIGSIMYRFDHRVNDNVSLPVSSFGSNIKITPLRLIKSFDSRRVNHDLYLYGSYSRMSVDYEDLSPEIIDEKEVGIGWNLKDYLGIKLSTYSRKLKDGIIFIPFDPLFRGFLNAAEIENSGLEIEWSMKGKLSHNIFASGFVRFQKTSNKVISLSNNLNQAFIQSFFYGGLFSLLVPGDNYGSIYGTTFAKYNGSYVLNFNGSYVSDGISRKIADPTPDYVLDYGGTLTVKSFSLSALLTYSKGGQMISYSASSLLGRGVTEDTQNERELPVVKEGVVFDALGNPDFINYQVFPYEAYFNAATGANQGSVFDASYLKLRELSLSWTISEQAIKGLPFQSISLNAFARNLLTIAYGFPKGINMDVSINSTGQSNIRGFDFITGPATRTFGLGINAKF